LPAMRQQLTKGLTIWLTIWLSVCNRPLVAQSESYRLTVQCTWCITYLWLQSTGSSSVICNWSLLQAPTTW